MRWGFFVSFFLCIYVGFVGNKWFGVFCGFFWECVYIMEILFMEDDKKFVGIFLYVVLIDF